MKDKIILFFATGTGLGLSRFAPGTLGTLWGIPLAIGVSSQGPYTGALILIIFLAFSVYISYEAIAILGSGDPGAVVIDEIIGYGFAFYLLPLTTVNLIMVFILFRFFDILKPFPINWVERKLPGGWGVVLDDVVAGILANISANIIIYLYLRYL